MNEPRGVSQRSGSPSPPPGTGKAPPARRILTDLSLVERLFLAVGLGTVLTMLMATSPTWAHLPDVGGLMPQRYVDTLGIIPVSTNTAVAWLAATVIGSIALVATKHPVVPLSGIVAVCLGLGAYAYARIHWHRIFLGGTGPETPSIGAWLLGLLVVAGLLVQPLVAQARTLLARYADKGMSRTELAPIRAMIVRTAATRGALATAFTLTIMLAIIALPRLGTPNRFFLDNSIVVLLIAGLLILAAVGIGAGVFALPKGKDADKPDE